MYLLVLVIDVNTKPLKVPSSLPNLQLENDLSAIKSSMSTLMERVKDISQYAHVFPSGLDKTLHGIFD